MRHYHIFVIHFFVCLSFSINLKAQYVADTLSSNSTGVNNPNGPISSYLYKYLFTLYNSTELAAKGIVPGVTIYGVAYNKTTNAHFSSTANATLEFKYRSGGIDTFLNPYNGNYSGTPQYLLNNYLLSGYSGVMQYATGSNLNIPTAPAWVPFMLDAPFIYTGGCLNIFSNWTATPNSIVGSPGFLIYNDGTQGVKSIDMSSNSISYINSGQGAVGISHKPSIVIYHSVNPTPCNNTPNGGTVLGYGYACVGKDFPLYLSNPSAGPGIGYQWQKAAIGSTSWSNVLGATLSAAIFNISTPTKFRCKVTCNNSGLSAYSNEFPLYPFAVHIDSVTHSISGNVITVQSYSNDTSTSQQTTVAYSFGDSVGVVYNPPIGTTQVSKTYTVDGNYIVKTFWYSDCSVDSFSFPITIGCAGSPTFVNTISSLKDSTCAGNPATLIINDTLPNNYSVEWYRFTWSGNILLGTTTVGNFSVPVSSPSDIFWNKAICNSSGNFKYSNWDTIYITPPPTAGTIQATNTSTNYYTFTNTGMSNAQSYVWYFGDGDSSTSLAPTHHYNLAGTYTVHFVATNAGNGCTDTATTTVNITTGIEDPQNKLFSVSPNPFNESFTVTCPASKGSLMIVDAVGKVVKSVVVKSGNAVIDMKGFSSGVYMIKYENDHETATQKIIKSN